MLNSFFFFFLKLGWVVESNVILLFSQQTHYQLSPLSPALGVCFPVPLNYIIKLLDSYQKKI